MFNEIKATKTEQNPFHLFLCKRKPLVDNRIKLMTSTAEAVGPIYHKFNREAVICYLLIN